MNDPRGRHAGFNAASRDQWDGFACHRRKVTELLLVGADRGRTRLCVLGSGNCNDLDLSALLDAHRDVTLVDVDAQALAQGVVRQGVADHPALHLFGGVDLTGMHEAFARWSPGVTIPYEDMARLVEEPVRRVSMLLPGPFDRVASTCLLSPLIGNAYHSVGERHPQFPALVKAIRVAHLRLLTHLVAPGGTAVLITDVVSSERFPALATLPDSELPGLLSRLAEERNFFHGLNPAVLPQVFRQDPVLKLRVAGLESVPPWRWRLHDRLYLVWALTYGVSQDAMNSRQGDVPGGVIADADRRRCP